MASNTDDMFLSLLVNSKKIKNTDDFKCLDDTNACDRNLTNVFQILEKNIKQSKLASDNLQQLTDYLKTRLPSIIVEFEKTVMCKID
jgi:hypothetical protein